MARHQIRHVSKVGSYVSFRLTPCAYFTRSIQWRQQEPLAVLQETAATHRVLEAPFLAFSLGRSYFYQNVRSSALSSAERSSGRNLSIVRQANQGYLILALKLPLSVWWNSMSVRRRKVPL
jgi:hypothetical protein